MSRITFISLIVLALAISQAYPHDALHPELNGWMKTLTNQRKGMCCDGSDALHLRDVDWETQNKTGLKNSYGGSFDSHYRVRVPATSIDDKNMVWVDVDDDALVTEPNKDGSTLVWPTYGYAGIHITCFMPGTMG